MITNNNYAKSFYDFDEKVEYNNYKKDVLNIACSNFYKWERQVSEKHQYKSIELLINFRAYLNKRIRDTERKKELISNIQFYISILISFGGVIATLIITLNQEQATVIAVLNHLWAILIIIIIAVVHYPNIINTDSKKSAFFNDYIKVIDNTITKMQKSPSTEGGCEKSP